MEYTPGDTIEFGKKPWRPIQYVFLLTDISKKNNLKKKKKKISSTCGSLSDSKNNTGFGFVRSFYV
jgi:hypothetical protein